VPYPDIYACCPALPQQRFWLVLDLKHRIPLPRNLALDDNTLHLNPDFSVYFDGNLSDLLENKLPVFEGEARLVEFQGLEPDRTLEPQLAERLPFFFNPASARMFDQNWWLTL
jgi:hypothetical protein